MAASGPPINSSSQLAAALVLHIRNESLNCDTCVSPAPVIIGDMARSGALSGRQIPGSYEQGFGRGLSSCLV